jgi:hypothetical protein
MRESDLLSSNSSELDDINDRDGPSSFETNKGLKIQSSCGGRLKFISRMSIVTEKSLIPLCANYNLIVIPDDASEQEKDTHRLLDRLGLYNNNVKEYLQDLRSAQSPAIEIIAEHRARQRLLSTNVFMESPQVDSQQSSLIGGFK